MQVDDLVYVLSVYPDDAITFADALETDLHVNVITQTSQTTIENDEVPLSCATD